MLYVFCVMHVNAQQKSDGFFSNKYTSYTRAYTYNSPTVALNQISGVGINNMSINGESVSLGNGLLALIAISASYLALRRKEEKK